MSTTVSANRRVRLVVPATSASAAVTSPITSYTVRPVVTLSRTAARTVRIAMRGAAGQRIRLERATHTGWAPVRTYAAATSRTVPGLVTGVRYLVVVSATAALGAATSPAVKA